MWEVLRKDDGYFIGRVSDPYRRFNRELLRLKGRVVYYNPKTGEVIY